MMWIDNLLTSLELSYIEETISSSVKSQNSIKIFFAKNLFLGFHAVEKF